MMNRENCAVIKEPQKSLTRPEYERKNVCLQGDSKMGSNQRTISELPNEILFSIFSYLKMYDVKYNISAVCRQWEMISKDKRLWKKLTYQTTSEGTKTFGIKSWESTLNFLETTPQLQNLIISQGHSDSEIIKILNALDSHCPNLRQLELDMVPGVTKHIPGLCNLTSKIESLRLWLVPEHSQKEVFKSLGSFSNLKEVAFISTNPQHRDFQLFLANCPNLEKLNVSNDGFCKTNFLMLLKKKEQLQDLYLRIDNLDSKCIRELLNFPKLAKLNLVDNNPSPDKLFLIGHLPCLESLLLREDASSPVLTSSALTEFFRGGCFANLREMKLHKSRLNDEGAVEIRRNCTVLSYLEVMTYPKSRSGLTEKALAHFLHCERLEYFEITFDSSSETDWIYRRIRHVKHECDIDGECPLGVDELLLSWDEIQIPVD